MSLFCYNLFCFKENVFGQVLLPRVLLISTIFFKYNSAKAGPMHGKKKEESEKNIS